MKRGKIPIEHYGGCKECDRHFKEMQKNQDSKLSKQLRRIIKRMKFEKPAWQKIKEL